MLLKKYLLLLLLAVPLLAPAQRRPIARPRPKPAAVITKKRPPSGQQPAFLRYLHSPWVDSLMRTLTPRQRVAQLFMLAAYSNKPAIYQDSISTLIRDYGIGGLIFFQGGPVRQARLLNRFQAQSRVPLLVAMDGEWGAGMRLDSVLKFPYQMSLGAVPAADSGLVYDMGREVARQFTRLGMQVNFAPVVDVNNNPANPVIGFRSWGENPAAVARLSRLYMKGMQDAGVLAVAKHFPGHGDVDADSHLALPVVRVDRQRLDTLELPPFKSMIANGIGGMMVAHLNVPALDTVRGPSTLSKPIITGILRQQLGFKGVVFTDAMNMKGLLSQVPPGEAEVRALLAGNDVLEFSKNVPLALASVLAAVDSGRISQARIDESCRRVLALKQWAGLRKRPVISEKDIIADLNPAHARYLAHRLTAHSLTLLRNQGNMLPVQRLDTLRMATLVLGGNPADTTDFQKAVASYAPMAHFHLPAAPTLDELVDIRARLFGYDVVLVALQSLGRLPATSFGIAPEANLLLRELTKPGQRVILSIFGSAYAAAKVRDFDRASAVVMAYQESPEAQELAAQLIFGGIGAVGKLPVTVANNLPAGFGLRTQPGLRLAYAHPEDAGLDGRLEARIDSVMAQALAAGATPGGQVLIARRGVVVLRKSYGYQAATNGATLPASLSASPAASSAASGFGSEPGAAAGAPPAQAAPGAGPQGPRRVQNTDLYDLASLTKVLAATPALLKLQEQGKFSPDSTLGQLFPFLRKTDKAGLKLRDVLTHQAGLPAWIPFWKDFAKTDGTLRRRWFRPDSSARFPLPVARGLWGRRQLPARIYGRIGDAPLNAKPGYVYSDLSFYLYPELVQRRTGQSFEQFLQKSVYQVLGSGLHFQPLHHAAENRIAPTEYDSLFRRQLLRGYVDDEGAALLGGVSGHAGLFGSANDVAQLAQTYAWGGRYGGQQVFSKEILADWTRQQFPGTANRRALAFDRPSAPAAGNTAPGASAGSFGHSGFTGTYFWVDPARELVVVVLTNRLNPSRRNNKLSDLNVRTQIQQVVIEAVR
ncbi:glycoside hydrolase family 3 N-terminal domain-containing protein [Hymenobacter sp. H14-R3]|uniref:glycoside hydrolase family 3 N-terminal domain-containing protein n=1 Tax=Hymenobacter sp. H14-R3 TaxID=3046308 RepID=UPI0024BA959C|nr:glycoside hydrolase family 3 N-terminal domain-containing protein [Hymenobacter sp. H14-R3]MDJ0365112.1 glycoside hydrolase family 3 N-terminal domain-containing protein [Hymenobacter sp. H14-R3]